MKHVGRILVFFLVVHFCDGQSYFNKKYDLGNSEAAMNVFSLPNNSYISVFQKSFGNTQAICIARVDANGDTVSTNQIERSEFLYYAAPNSILQLNDSNFLIAGSVVDTLGNSSAMLLKFNLLGDTLWQRLYTDTNFIAGRDCHQNKDGTIILTGGVVLPSTSDLAYFLIKTDSNGNLIWKKTFNNSPYSDGAVYCRETLDKGYIISGYTQPYGLRSDNWMVKTDSAGIIQWDKQYSATYEDGWCWVTQLPDSCFIVAGKRAMGSSTARGRIRKIDKNGNSLWMKEITNTNYFGFAYEPLLLEDGSFVVCGITAQPNNTTWWRGVLMKFDSLGNELWRRFYSTNNNQVHGFYDFRRTADNGFVMCGTAYGTSQDAWIVKVDSFGCEVAGCDAIGFSELENSYSGFTIYPNPASETVFVQANGEKEINIEILDIAGNVILSEKHQVTENNVRIDLKEISDGIYFMRASDSAMSSSIVRKIVISH